MLRSLSVRNMLSLYGCACPSKPDVPCQRFALAWLPVIRLHFNLAILSSRKRFFGSMPLTALLSTSPPPHFAIILSIVISFKLPGRVVWL